MSVRTILKHVYENGGMTEYQYERIDRVLKERERPHGEWIDITGRNDFVCSVCKHKAQIGCIAYCGSCGASMSANGEQVTGKSNSEKTCLNCGTSEQECELGNRARHGFCGNWTERR